MCEPVVKNHLQLKILFHFIDSCRNVDSLIAFAISGKWRFERVSSIFDNGTISCSNDKMKIKLKTKKEIEKSFAVRPQFISLLPRDGPLLIRHWHDVDGTEALFDDEERIIDAADHAQTMTSLMLILGNLTYKGFEIHGSCQLFLTAVFEKVPDVEELKCTVDTFLDISQVAPLQSLKKLSLSGKLSNSNFFLERLKTLPALEELEIKFVLFHLEVSDAIVVSGIKRLILFQTVNFSSLTEHLGAASELLKLFPNCISIEIILFDSHHLARIDEITHQQNVISNYRFPLLQVDASTETPKFWLTLRKCIYNKMKTQVESMNFVYQKPSNAYEHQQTFNNVSLLQQLMLVEEPEEEDL